MTLRPVRRSATWPEELWVWRFCREEEEEEKEVRLGHSVNGGNQFQCFTDDNVSDLNVKVSELVLCKLEQLQDQRPR